MRCRVSLFLAEGIQLQSGKLVMPSCIHNRVGLVRSFAADGSLESEEKLQLASQAVSTAVGWRRTYGSKGHMNFASSNGAHRERQIPLLGEL